MVITEKKSHVTVLEGTVARVEVRKLAAIGPTYGREAYDVRLAVLFQPDGGAPIDFLSPVARHSIAHGGPFYISTVQGNDWIGEEPWSCEGVNGAAGFGGCPKALVGIGDRLRIRIATDTRGRKRVKLVARLPREEE